MSSRADISSRGFAHASAYDAYRPPYPPEATDNLLRELQVSGLKGARIIDLAAGTGKFTESIASRDEQFEIIAVEPHQDMRAELKKKGLRNVRVMAGEATDMAVTTQSVDAVVVAQAFHWFANEKALQEIYRVLVPGGVLGLIWNIEDYNAPRSWLPSTQWESKLKAITWSNGNDNPRFRHEQWKEVFEKQLESTPFSIQSADPLFSLPLGENTFNFTHWMTRDAIWNRYRTQSQFAVLGEERLAEVKKTVLETISGSDVETNENGEIAVHGCTTFYWTTCIPGAPLKDGG